MATPVQPTPGDIYRHTRFYQNTQGHWQTKYLLLLTHTSDGDVVFRLLTSRAYDRPEHPPCYHGDPYPGFYLGYLGGGLTAKSWLDLRKQDDYDGQAFIAHFNAGWLVPVLTLPLNLLCAALDCAASANDTTKQQERLMRDQRTVLNCR